jgi:hypothetical protein
MANQHRKLISFDWAIKKILRSKVNFETLKELLRKKRTIAKKTLAKNTDIELIVEFTGLSVEEIGKL